MIFNTREALALMFTAPNVTRAGMARFLGTSPRTLGRIISGERDATGILGQNIITAFRIFDREARKNAQMLNLEYVYPIWLNRPPRRDGKPSERVVINNTDHMTREMRERALIELFRTKAYIGVSVRSTINISAYNDNTNKRIIPPRNPSESRWRDDMEFKQYGGEAVIEKVNRRTGEITEQIVMALPQQTSAIYTPTAHIFDNRRIKSSLDVMEARIADRHEPATGGAGTALADGILLQLYPATYEHKKQTVRRNRRAIRGRGNK